jgi:putative ATP-dependent endonuclease of OLD family
MRILEVEVSHYREFGNEVVWKPGAHGVLVGPNNAGKTTLLRAADLVLNPYRDAYRNRLTVWEYPECDTTSPVKIRVVLGDLSEEDRDHFEPYVEGRHEDGSFGGWDSPGAEFDTGELVLRLAFEGIYGEPSRAFFARPEAGGAPVRQADKIRVGWTYVPAGLDPAHELAFYGGSVLSRLFERDDLSDPLDAIRTAIDGAKGPLLSHPAVKGTRGRLQEAAQQLGLAPAGDAIDFAVAGLSDRRVLQSLQLVLQGTGSPVHLPLEAHGRGTSRVLLLAALLQQARGENGNLILAVEEPEQNLEPINQRLVTRSLLLAPDAGASQVILATHSAEVAGVVPLRDLHLVRDDTLPVRALRDATRSEHKFFERHAQGALVAGLYARAVLLVEGPTERGAVPTLWADHRPGDGLDEHRIELIDCESIRNMPSFARFFAAVGVPVIAVCDADVPGVCGDVARAGAELIVRWSTHTDWEGVLAAEGDPEELATSLEACRVSIGPWTDHAAQIADCLKRDIGESAHLLLAGDVKEAILGYEPTQRREAIVTLLRGRSGLDFKSTMYGREIAVSLSAVPPTVAAMIDKVHLCLAGDTTARGTVDL